MTRNVLFITALFLAAAAWARAAEPFFMSEEIFPFDEKRPVNHASSIAQLPDGSLMATWFGGSSEGLADVALWMSRRPAGADGWTAPVPLVDEPGIAEGNSVLFVDSKDRVWLFFVRKYAERWDAWEEAKIFLQASEDGGGTWTEPRLLLDETGWMIRNGVVELGDGRLLLPVYSDLEPRRSGLWISSDGFKTWEQRLVPATEPANYQPAFINPADDILIVFARHHTVPGKVWFSMSNDLGKSWREPRTLKFPNPDSGLDALSAGGKKIILVYNDSPVVRTPLSAAMSGDGGRSWPFEKEIENEVMEYSYPFMIRTDDGMVHVSYTADDRRVIKHAVFNEEWLKSKG